MTNPIRRIIIRKKKCTILGELLSLFNEKCTKTVRKSVRILVANEAHVQNRKKVASNKDRQKVLHFFVAIGVIESFFAILFVPLGFEHF